MDFNGRHVKRLTNTPEHEGSPTYSPDGSAIAYVTYGTSKDIYVMPAAGGVPVNLTQTPSVEEVSPHWSPDGFHILYKVIGPSGSAIVTMDADGSNPTELVFDETNSIGVPGLVAGWNADHLQRQWRPSRHGR